MKPLKSSLTVLAPALILTIVFAAPLIKKPVSRAPAVEVKKQSLFEKYSVSKNVSKILVTKLY
jgi:hypothetical protein